MSVLSQSRACERSSRALSIVAWLFSSDADSVANSGGPASRGIGAARSPWLICSADEVRRRRGAVSRRMYHTPAATPTRATMAVLAVSTSSAVRSVACKLSMGRATSAASAVADGWPGRANWETR